MSESGEIQGLPLEGLDITPTPEETAGKIANRIFRPWYKQYYEGRYTQSTPFIARVLKQTVLKCVVEGEDTEEIIIRAMQMLGLKQQVVTEASLQYSLSIARREAESRRKASVWHGGAHGGDVKDGEESEESDETDLSDWEALWEAAMTGSDDEDDKDYKDNQDNRDTSNVW